MTVELSERVKAISRGEDPDAVSAEVVVKAETKESETAEPEEGVEAEGETVEQEAEEESVAETEEEPEEEAEEESVTEDWLTDGLRRLADSYGIGEDEARGFGSAEEFSRAMGLLDKYGLPATPEKSEEPPAETLEKRETKAEETPSPTIDVQKYKDAGYDDDTVALAEVASRLEKDAATRQRELAALQATVKELQGGREKDAATRQQEAENQFFGTFHDILDTRDEQLYGRSLNGEDVVDLSAKHGKNREDVYDAYRTIEAGLIAHGRKVPDMSVLIERAERLALTPQKAAKAEEKRQEKIAAQSKRRRPAGRSPKPAATELADEDMGRHPVIQEKWKRMQEAVGAS